MTKQLHLTIKGSPVSVNSLYANSGRKRILTWAGKAAKHDFEWQVRQQYKGVILTGDCKVEIVAYYKDNRRRDIDNGLKMVLDSLTGIVLKDDSQISDLHIQKRLDKESPRVELDLWITDVDDVPGW